MAQERNSLLWGIFAGLAVLVTAAAEAEEKGTFTLVWENDVVARTDRHYTNGLRASYATPAIQERNGLERLVSGSRNDDATWRRSFALSQAIYTPERTQTTYLPEDEHPYNGYLYGEYALLSEDKGRWELFTVELGVVGPWALGEEAQNWFHRRMDVLESQGWDTQQDNEVTINIAYDWKGRPLWQGQAGGLHAELTPTAGASLGTVDINARAGGMVRVGNRQGNDFGPARIRPSLTSSGHFTDNEQLTWYAFAGIQGRAIAHELFLDGSFFQDSESVDKYAFVGDLQAGFAIEVGRAQLSYTYIRRTERFKTQDGMDAYGAITLSTKF